MFDFDIIMLSNFQVAEHPEMAHKLLRVVGKASCPFCCLADEAGGAINSAPPYPIWHSASWVGCVAFQPELHMEWTSTGRPVDFGSSLQVADPNLD